MRIYFVVVILLLVGPLSGYFVWHSKLTTEQQVLQERAEAIKTRETRARQLVAKLPPAGSVMQNTIKRPLDPPPVCDGRTGECNLQIAEFLMIDDPDRWSQNGVHLTNRGPFNLSGTLQYLIGQSRKPHDRTHEKIWSFVKTIDQGLQCRYLLVHRHLNRQTAKGLETVGIEVFLLDMDRKTILGGLRYPDKLVNAEEAGQRYPYLSEVLGGKISPNYPLRHDPRKNDIERVTILVVAWTVVMGMLFIASIPVAVMMRRQQRRVEAIEERGEYPDELQCPVCLTMTDSLKQYSTLRYAFFIGIGGGGEKETVTACPRCMRRHLRKRFLVNLIPANLLMLGFGPMFLFQWLRTFGRGHSPGAIEPQGK